MSDSDKNLEILIKTKADLTGAKAAGAQLEQDIAQAKALGEAYDELESKLKNVRLAIAENQGNDALFPSRSPGDASPETLIRRREDAMAGQAPSPSPTRWERVASDSPSERRRGPEGEANEEKGGNGMLGWVKTGLEGLRLAVEAMSNFFATVKNPIAGPSANQVPEKTDIAGPATPALVNAPQPAFSNRTGEQVAGGSAQATEQTPEADGQQENETVGQVVASHAQAVQFSGEKMRAALEQNTQITVSLFNRTLELIDQQNRKLSEVDRRIAELSGQIKSLKNL